MYNSFDSTQVYPRKAGACYYLYFIDLNKSSPKNIFLNLAWTSYAIRTVLIIYHCDRWSCFTGVTVMYKIYLRSHAHNQEGDVLERILPTPAPTAAEAAYRRMLARDDLVGKPVAAVLSHNRKTIYFSRFDREPRIHPDAPLDLFIDYDGTTEAAKWSPTTFTLPDTPQPADIAAAREHLGLTQKQIAPLLGYSDTPRISEIENGARNPSGAVTLLLRAYLAGYRPTDWPR